MKLNRMIALAEKDLRESTATSQVLLPMMIVPLVFVIAYPAALLIGLRFPGAIAELGELTEMLPPGAIPAIAGLGPAASIAYVAIVYMFAPFFLIIPVMVSTVLAANSFAGEKERHTLEGLLYTPLTDTELVFAKVAGAALPAMAFAWVCFAIYTVLVNALGVELIGRIYFPTANWWVLMLLVVPAACLFVTIATTWVSAKVQGYQEANSVAGLAMVPIMVLVFGQVTGVMIAGPLVFGVLGAVLVFADVLLVRWVVKTLDREKAVSSFV